jgi:hypothetical protein
MFEEELKGLLKDGGPSTDREASVPPEPVKRPAHRPSTPFSCRPAKTTPPAPERAAAPPQAATSQAATSEPPPERPPAAKPESSQRPARSVSDPAVVASRNKQATILENTVFPAGILAGLSLDKTATVTALRALFIRFREEAGGSRDSVEKLLLNQLLAAHMKVADLYALAAESKQLEFKALYTSAAARLLSSICQLVTTLTSYRASTRGRGRGRGHRRGKATKRKSRSVDDAPAGQENRTAD